MYDYLFEVNKQNAFTLAVKHNMADYERDYIHHCFWPIIIINNYDVETIKEKINSLKNEFIKENTIFDLEIFNRENTDYLVYVLKQFIDVLERGKVEMWDEYGDENFYIFKMESDTKDSTLIISDKNITQLEIYFKSILSLVQEFIKEQNNIDKIKNSKKTNIDIFKELNDFEVFSNDLKDETKALFSKNISKNEALNIYYKDYLPKYLTRINKLISHLEQMQNEFKLHFPELQSDLEKLNAITSKFKKNVLNDFEITLNKVLKSDYERCLFEYVNFTNKLEIDLEIEGKKISDFFKLFYNRMLHIKSNPKPPEATTELQNKQIIQIGYNYEPFLDINNEYYIRLEQHKESFQSRFPFIDENDIQTEFEVNDFLENEHYDLNIIFEQEYNVFIENSIYFYGCPFEIYLKTYLERLKSFLNEFPDANEIDFCTYELNSNITYIASKFINDKIGYSIKKRIEFLNNKLEPKLTTNQPEPLNLSDTSTVEKPSFTNEFDKVSESKVIEYFTKNLVEKKYLTEIELNKYLKQAFELRNTPKEKYSFKNIDSIENIVHVFYKYYKDVTTESTYGRQSEYFNLLKNYFNGFEKIHIKNFSKQYDSIRNVRN